MEIGAFEYEQGGETDKVPEWFGKYTDKLRQEKTDLLAEVDRLSEMNLENLTQHIGGNVNELPYEFLQTIFIDGSDDPRVADILREKRGEYLKSHPEKQVAKGASEGIIAHDGRFIPKALWDTATDSEKRGVMVGSTCFHYNSETPGMGSSPEDRF
ncbi:MAG: hypothetical protein UX12_C0020G0003 [Candidatus Collierbacteria bacterium GW2011_GWC1_45_47]|uniref:Uncharacterized protein n=6 Tax=Candidatus Collieribacteriota TaxID=1752725 RepID=A0A0G1HI53_9BACT|nr:MAG: hypothetical protein UW23_C0010G0003 [Candidatus Collierbacteria bacterium GW2011_GWA1_44_12]KKT39323.1 MAG: hypothetical protein UW26_C0004G0010 [Candidatus Collierbacteria bacterium GW2011_GWF1_44_12]KKT46243.1 MAG: hypothetical protein UW35_C0018G0006 [Candidatus Collierbacteria bacterium GW2011_GWF2_44_15]KKT67901.1 MAG: hypothetical protein UW62_C0011G0003 [Candidatus Collierbacteria bacterium GW2011_GWB1_44_35]KKT98911.1 MAG: hypothetical protein UW99_C0014G0011 [Candidatus Collie